MVKIVLLILLVDFLRLGEDIERIDKGGVEFVYIDVMDGLFVFNIFLGLFVIKFIRNRINKVFDVYLMVDNFLRYIDDFIEVGLDIIIVYYEVDRYIDRIINYIKLKGKKVGVLLNFGILVSVLKDLIFSLDMVLIMLVNFGFGG